MKDERLVRRAAKGDRGAFEAIYRRYGQDLYRFCLALVGNAQDAQDALQNTMLKVLRALPGEERPIQLRPWLYRIARNESLETLRKRRDSAELDHEQMPATWELAETAEARERLRGLLRDLDELPDRQRAALVMRELAGLEFEEIGRSFETSAAVARQTVYEARLSLREMDAGREMSCQAVMRELSDADGRVTRRRAIRAHLRECASCRAFREDIAERRSDLAAIAPLPLAVSAGLLQGLFGSQAGAAAGKAVAASVVAKSAATVAVATVVGVSAADRSGLIDVPLPGGKTPAETSTGAGQDPRIPPATGEIGSGGGSGAAATGNGENAAVGKSRSSEGPSAGRQVSGADPANPEDVLRGADRSRSEAGLNPPGGGFGRSAAERRGRPEELPSAARRGQQTAASHRPAHAGARPPKGSGGKGAQGGSPSKPATSPKGKAQGAPPHPPAPPSKQASTDDLPASPPGHDSP